MVRIEMSGFFENTSANRKMEYLYLSLMNNERGYVLADEESYVIYENAKGQLYLPIYPSVNTARYVVEKNMINVDIEEVSLEEIYEEILPELDNNAIFLGCYYDGKNGILISPIEFMKNLE